LGDEDRDDIADVSLLIGSHTVDRISCPDALPQFLPLPLYDHAAAVFDCHTEGAPAASRI
jgi:hypothetical protein